MKEKKMNLIATRTRTESGSDRMLALKKRYHQYFQLSLGSGRIHHPKRAARLGNPVRSRFCIWWPRQDLRAGFISKLRTTTIALGLILFAVICIAQTPDGPPQGARGVIRLRVKLKVGDATKGLSRKRFFLIKGSLADSKTLVEGFEQRPIVSRDCYYRGVGASEALLHWLKENDCESVYCREVEANDVEGPNAVPEFQHALAAGEKEFQSRELARKWLTVNLSEEIRSGFYKRQQTNLQALLQQAEESSRAKVMSVTTDRNGSAYFTEIEPGTYIISNIIPTEAGDVTELWNCEVSVKAGDLAAEKPFLISNRKDKNVKCVAIEKPLPACAARARPSAMISAMIHFDESLR
jgi:hypothetical protein